MPAIRQHDQRIAAVRGFNRFYTRQIGVLRKTFLDSPYSLGEARVLYEIASGRSSTATEIGRALDLDAGYLSRVLRNFEKRGLIERKASVRDARQSHLRLSPRGRKAYAPLEQRSQRDTGALLGRLKPDEQTQLIAAMTTIETLLRGGTQTVPRPGYILRAPRPGDFGWVVKRNAELYAQEYRWREPFEGVCAQIVADFANKFDSKRERCWIAEIERRECRLHFPRQGFGDGCPCPPAAGGPESARAWARRSPRRRMPALRPPRRLQESHAMDPLGADRGAAYLREGRFQTDAQRAT